MIGEGASPGTWLTAFRPFTLTHLLVDGACLAMIVAACVAGRAWLGTPRERRLRLGIAWGAGITSLASNAYFLWPTRFDLRDALPLQMCDLSIIIAALAMGTQRRLWRLLLYFWGLLLSSQAFVTPILREGASHPRFWLFWLVHLFIVGPAIYDLAVRRFRPNRYDLGVAIACGVAYSGMVACVNVPLGLNYGFMGDSRPENPTIVDVLGPWPLRVLWIALIVTGLFTLGWLVWEVPRRIRRR